MQALIAQQYGDESVLKVVDRPEPNGEAGSVPVEMRATTVSVVDTLIRSGATASMTPDLTPPIVLGWDIAGVVQSDGERFAAGDRVVGMIPWFELGGTRGTNQEVVIADERWLVRLPESVDWDIAAALPLDGTTATQALRLAGPRRGDTLLVTGASGPVGGFVTELATLDGVRVLALASTGDEEHVNSLGAAHVLPRQNPGDLVHAVRAIAPDGVDAVFDAALLGNGVIGAVRDGGRFVTAFDPFAPAAERSITIDGVHARPDATDLAHVVELVAAAQLHPRIAIRLPLDRAAEGHHQIESRSVRGKVVLSF